MGGWYPSMPCGRSPGGVCYPSMHCRWYPSMPCNRSQGGGGVPGPGWGVCSRGRGAWSWGGLLQGLLSGGCLVWGVCSQGGWYPSMHLGSPPGETVTAVDGTHPTGMHSFYYYYYYYYYYY